MQGLDPRTLVNALGEIERHSASDSASERRVFVRHPVRVRATIWVDSHWETGAPNMNVEAHVRDVSRGGVALLVQQALEVGRAYRLVCVSEGVELFATTVVPRHVSSLADGLVNAGCVFVAEGAWLVSLGVSAAAIRGGERTGLSAGEGEFSGVAA